LAVDNKPFDVVTVSETLTNVEEVGGLGYLAELAKNTPSVANILACAEIVKERAHLRQLRGCLIGLKLKYQKGIVNFNRYASPSALLRT
jgi:replicative DNA helicase